MSEWYIYGLVDPRTDQIRYIGVTMHPQARLNAHLKESQEGNSPKNKWIRQLVSRGRQPRMKILETVSTEATAREAERQWIMACHKAGMTLTNSMGVPRKLLHQSGDNYQ